MLDLVFVIMPRTLCPVFPCLGKIASCMVPVPMSVSEYNDCMPVTGAVRLYFNTTGIPAEEKENQKLSIESGFQRLIRFGMLQELYVSGDVRHVSFIGTRIEDTVAVTPPPEVNADRPAIDQDNVTDAEDSADITVSDVESDEASRNAAAPDNVQGQTAWIIIGSVGAVVLCLLVLSVLAVQRRQQQAVAAAAESDDAEDSSELEGDKEGRKTMSGDDDDDKAVSAARQQAEHQTNLSPSSMYYLDPLHTMIADTMEDEDENDSVRTQDEPLVKAGSVKVFKDDDDEDDDEDDGYQTDEESQANAAYSSPWIQGSQGLSYRSHAPAVEQLYIAPPMEDSSSPYEPNTTSSLPALANDWP